MTSMTAAVTAAEKMDAIYRRQRFIYDATRRYYLFGRDRLIRHLDPPEGGLVLEAGCGTARNLIRAAQTYRTVRFCGLDVSEAMLRSARISVERSGLPSRISLAKGDATAFNPAMLFGHSLFDRVFISYSLSMIPQWRDVVRCAAACVPPGGKLVILDFGGFEDYPALLRRAQLAWLRRFSARPIPSMESEIGMLAEQMGFALTAKQLYGGYAILACLQRS
jgi:S-adenosylmethionine-diacylgycerolhomoserine-N-methlytransferase